MGIVGQAVATRQAVEAAAACAPLATAPVPGLPIPARIAVELDGAWGHSHDNAPGLEGKVGVVHSGGVSVGSRRQALAERAYAATAPGVVAFGSLMTAVIEARDGFAPTVQELVGDGARWIWRLGERVLPEATRVLDRGHVTDARRRALRAAVPDKAPRAPWRVRLEERREQRDVPGTLAVLEAVASMMPHPVLPECAGYVTHLAPCIPN